MIGKLIWTLQERPDLCTAVIECARAVAAPTEYHVMKLKRICRYIAGTVDSHMTLIIDERQPVDRVYLLTDASWARGLDRRSTSGIIVQYRGVTIGVWSRTQKPIAHSSCEAEITAASMGLQEAKLLVSMIKEIHTALSLEMNPMIHLSMDSTAAAAFSARRGPGAMKHIQIKLLSVQDDVRNKEVKISYVPTNDLVADYLTKPVTAQKLNDFKAYIGLRTTVSTAHIALEPAMDDHEVCAVWETVEPRDLESQQDYSVLNLILVLASMAPNLINFIGFGDIHGPKSYKSYRVW